jgi:hypothetical protein
MEQAQETKMKPEVELAMTFGGFARYCHAAGLDRHPLAGMLYRTLCDQIRALAPENEPYFREPLEPIRLDTVVALLDEVDRLVDEYLNGSSSWNEARLVHALGRLRLRVLEDAGRPPAQAPAITQEAPDYRPVRGGFL